MFTWLAEISEAWLLQAQVCREPAAFVAIGEPTYCEDAVGARCFASPDDCAVGDDIGRQVMGLHIRQQGHGCMWLLPLFASADGCAVGDDIERQAMGLHTRSRLYVAAAPFLKRADGCAVGDDIGSKVMGRHICQQGHGCTWL